jgi:hypothetical protein
MAQPRHAFLHATLATHLATPSISGDLDQMSMTPPPMDQEPGPRPNVAQDAPRRTTSIVLVSIGATLALVLALFAAVLALGGDGDDSADGEVFLEPAASAGSEPFTTDVPTDTPDPAAMAVPPATPAGSSGATNAIRSEQGDRSGLYGGTLDVGRCDPKKLVDYLHANPVKAQAWVDALNRDTTLRWSGGTVVTVDQIAAYVAELTPIILVTDTRVTNYGFSNGHPTPRQAVLQRGTAVLVDSYGVPRTKCNCGNPLTTPTAARGKVTYTGDKWSTFDPTTIIVVQHTTVVIETYVLVDIDHGGTFERPVGSTGTDDVNIDVGGASPPTSGPPVSEPPPSAAPTTTVRPSTTMPAETRTGARTYCEALELYVNQAADLVDASEEEFLRFLEDAIYDLADLAPPEVRADWEYYRDVALSDYLADGTYDADMEAIDARLSAHASSACGLTID